MNKLTYLCAMVICVFLLDLSPINASNLNQPNSSNEIQRVRLDFTMPNGYVRHLLLGFTPDNAATEGVDYGYDALNVDNYPNDLSWMIENQAYVIQGVGEFNDNNRYPLGMFLSEGGTIDIALNTIENFEIPIQVFIYDAFLNTYTCISDVSFNGEYSSGEYLDRFFITFNNNPLLSISDQIETVAQIKYYRNSNELNITSNRNISQIEVYNLLGKKIFFKQNVNSEKLNVKISYVNSPYALVRIYTDAGIITKKILLK